MLVLSRKCGESIIIDVGGGVKISVLFANKNRASLSFEADKKITIVREELWDVAKRQIKTDLKKEKSL